MPDPKVILLGGTSHAGKSTLARAVASSLGWRTLSTDQLARHPGRPWALPPQFVPTHVDEHYRTNEIARHEVWKLREVDLRHPGFPR